MVCSLVLVRVVLVLVCSIGFIISVSGLFFCNWFMKWVSMCMLLVLFSRLVLIMCGGRLVVSVVSWV